jgi:hypothetical protein
LELRSSSIIANTIKAFSEEIRPARRSLSYRKSRRTMTDQQARRHAASEWLMEFSVLWAVFPLLDSLVENQPVAEWILAVSVGISLTTALAGLILRRGERR